MTWAAWGVQRQRPNNCPPQVFCTVCTDPKTLLQPLHGLADLVLGTHCLVPLLEGLQRLFRGVAVLLQPIQEHPAAN